MSDKRFSALLYGMIVVYIGILVVVNRSVLFTRYDTEAAAQEYNNSKYVLGEKGQPMSDDTVYAFAGYAYMSGVPPTQINFEHPPFVKYLYGAAIRWFGSPSWVVMASLALVAVCFVKLAHELYGTRVGIVVALGAYLANSLAYGFSTKTLLDMPLAALQIASVVCYLLFMKKSSRGRAVKWGVVAGLSLSAKYPVPITILLQMLLLGFALMRTKRLKEIMGVGAVMVATYLATYAPFFMAGNSLLDFIKFEYWRFHWFLGKTDAPKGLIFQTLFFGRHRAWWNGQQVVYEKFSVLWPASAVAFIWAWARVRGVAKHPLFPYMMWATLALFLYALGASNDFYLVPLMPVFVLFGGAAVEKSIQHIQIRSHAKIVQEKRRYV